jgi:hypothetical protein
MSSRASATMRSPYSRRSPRSEDARRLAAHLERTLVGSGVGVTFGWATYPQDGDNALALYRAGDERLYARRVISRN